MPYQIEWLPDAAKDVARLRDFIQDKNPTAAKRAAKAIIESSKLIKKNPLAGRPVTDLSKFREVIVPFGAGNYVLRYRQDGAKVVIVRVWHSKELRV